MNVTVVLYGQFRDTAGTREIEYDLPEDSTVRHAIDALLAETPALEIALGDDRGTAAQVTRNKTHISHENGLETSLEDGDVVRIFSPVTGG